jgi:BASS family bile acid:Na+ symporter
VSPAKIAAIVVLVSLTFGAGLEVNRATLVAILKDAGLLVRALLANFVLIPLCGILLVRLFRLDADVATGFLLMAIAPGVPFVLMSAREKGGSLGFAVALTVLFPLLSILTVPLTAELVLPGGGLGNLSLTSFFVTLVLFQFVPLIAGMFVGERAPGLLPKIQRPVQLVFAAALIALFALQGAAVLGAIPVVFGSRVGMATVAIVVLSIGLGWLFGGPRSQDRRTLSSASLLRNIGLCAVIGTAAFPNTRVMPAVLTYFLVQIVANIVLSMYFKRTAVPAGADVSSA